MKKLLLIPLFLFSCCTNSVKIETKEYGEGLTQEELFNQAADLKGIACIKIGDTYKTIESNLSKHNKQFRGLFNEYGLIKENSIDLPFDFKNLNIYDGHYSFKNSDEDYNKSHYDQRKSVDLIITEDFAVDLALFFCNDTLYRIDAKNQERELAKLFKEKYGEGRGSYKNKTILGKKKTLKSSENITFRDWENETVKARYFDHFSYNYENKDDFTNGVYSTFSIESKIIDKKVIDDRNNEIKDKIKAEEAEQKNQFLDML